MMNDERCGCKFIIPRSAFIVPEALASNHHHVTRDRAA